MKSFEKRQKRESEHQDYMNYLLGRYIAMAFNDPKNYPNEPFLHNLNNKNKTMTSHEMEMFGEILAQKYKKG